MRRVRVLVRKTFPSWHGIVASSLRATPSESSRSSTAGSCSPTCPMSCAASHNLENQAATFWKTQSQLPRTPAQGTWYHLRWQHSWRAGEQTQFGLKMQAEMSLSAFGATCATCVVADRAPLAAFQLALSSLRSCHHSSAARLPAWLLCGLFVCIPYGKRRRCHAPDPDPDPDPDPTSFGQRTVKGWISRALPSKQNKGSDVRW